MIINLTPHAIALYAEGDCTPAKGGTFTLNEGAAPVATFPSEGVARAAMSETVTDTVEVNGRSVSVFRMEYGAPTALPEPQEGVLLVVSALTAQAAARSGRTTSDLLMVAHLVRDAEGKVLGCTGFSQL